MNYISKYYTIALVINNTKVYDHIISNKASKGRYIDYTIRRLIKSTIEELIKLPGIGRKCASVILSEIYDIPAFAVDTHVIRISNRLGLVKTKDPVKIEKELKKLFEENTWNKKHKQLVLFGRYYCKAKNPNCQNCKLQKICLKKD